MGSNRCHIPYWIIHGMFRADNDGVISSMARKSHGSMMFPLISLSQPLTSKVTIKGDPNLARHPPPDIRRPYECDVRSPRATFISDMTRQFHELFWTQQQNRITCIYIYNSDITLIIYIYMCVCI